MKKVILIILVTVIFTILLVPTVKAQTSTVPLGAGTIGDPYQIATINNLYWLTQTSSAWATGKYIIQTANIDASSSSGWASGAGFSPIGNNSTRFNANYNGQGYSISNLAMNRPAEYATAPFGWVNSGGVIRNVCMTNVSITGGTLAGGLVGYLYGGSIQKCYSTGFVSGKFAIGGLVAVTETNTASVSESYSNANVQATQTGGHYIGGFAGEHRGTSTNCYATGNVTVVAGQTFSGAGGFAGANYAMYGLGTLINCYASGTITGTGTKGGLVGTVYNGTYTNCFYNKDILPIAGPGTGKTTAEMKTQATYTSWDFSTIWNINASYNSGYPYLRNIIYQPDPNTWTGAISTDWSNTGNWSMNSLPLSTDNIVIPNVSNQPIIGVGNTGSTNNITINSGSSLTVNGTLNMYGSVTNSGTFTTSSGAINFVGSSAQNTTGLSGSFGSVTINNTNGVTLTSNTSVSGTLTLTSGLLILGSYNLTLGATATIDGTPSATNMIVTNGTGEVRKIFTSTDIFEFPVGDNTGTAEYSPAEIGFSTGIFSSAYVSVQVSNGKYSNNTSNTNYLNRYWTINQSGITNYDYALRLNYVPADVVGTETDIWCGKYSGGGWILLSQAEPDIHQFTMLSITSFSTFTGGEQGVMPVSLSSFTSNVAGQNVNLKWITSSEQNNSGFNIERKTLDGSWSKVGHVAGNGTRNTPTTYNFNDMRLNTGKYNYRLKQIDNNGNFEYYNMDGTIEVGVPKNFDLSQNYPNPFNPATKIDFSLPFDSKVNLIIYDLTGREVKTLVNVSRQAGYHTVEMNASMLSSGTYFFRIIANANGKDFISTKKMVLVK